MKRTWKIEKHFVSNDGDLWSYPEDEVYVVESWVGDYDDWLLYGEPQPTYRKAKRIMNRARKGKIQGYVGDTIY